MISSYAASSQDGRALQSSMSTKMGSEARDNGGGASLTWWMRDGGLLSLVPLLPAGSSGSVVRCLHRQGMESSSSLSWWSTCGWLLWQPSTSDAPSGKVSLVHLGAG